MIVAGRQETLAMYAIGLMAMGLHPAVAKNADEAFARACQLCPDVIVADVSLPEPSRLALMRRLRDDARTRSAGIIVLDDANEVALGPQILALIASRRGASIARAK